MAQLQYEVGLGRKNFYVLVIGRKTPIAKRHIASFSGGDAEVRIWAKQQFENYLKKRR